MLFHYIEKIKSWCVESKQDLFVAALIFLTGMASFGLGRLSAIWPKKEPITVTDQGFGIRNPKEEGKNLDGKTVESTASVLMTQGKYVASKQGSKYHYPWCPGASTIKEENKIWFQTAEEARARGYRPAQNCPDLD